MATNKRIGVCLTIGVNNPNPNSSAYQSVRFAPLLGCAKDSETIKTLAGAAKFKSIVSLIDEDATRDRVLNEIQNAAKTLVGTRGIFLFHFSGHGMQGLPGGADTDSTGRPISCLLLRDAPLASYELYKEWSNFDEGVRILALSDSCHSGRIVKGVSTTIPRGIPLSDQATIRKNNPVFFGQISHRAATGPADVPKASVLLLSGCKVDETSGDSPDGGLFTSTLAEIWDGNRFKGDYDDFHQEVMNQVNQKSMASTDPQSPQHPDIYFVGAQGFEDDMAVFLNQKPFTI